MENEKRENGERKRKKAKGGKKENKDGEIRQRVKEREAEKKIEKERI